MVETYLAVYVAIGLVFSLVTAIALGSEGKLLDKKEGFFITLGISSLMLLGVAVGWVLAVPIFIYFKFRK